MNIREQVAGHYARASIAVTILAPGEALTAAHPAPADEFHIGGIEARRRLVPMLGLEDGMNVLDIGRGIGGTARAIALTAAYVETTDLLSQAVGLQLLIGEGFGLRMANLAGGSIIMRPRTT